MLFLCPEKTVAKNLFWTLVKKTDIIAKLFQALAVRIGKMRISRV